MTSSSLSSDNLGQSTPQIYSRSDHNISRRNIDSDALKIMYRLIAHDYKAYLVGGGVRDLLLNKSPKDFDIGTDATPKQIKRLFRNCRIIGRRFKLAHIFFHGGKIIEVSTFRDSSEQIADETDEISNGDNIFGDERTDALRRDITINALFYDLSNFTIIDYVNGVDDLRQRIVRVVGDPRVRIAEDPVRMLRILRHSVRAGFTIEESAWSAICELHELINQCPKVRVYQEFLRDLSSGFLLPLFDKLEQCQLLPQLLPELVGPNPESTMLSNLHFREAIRGIDTMITAGISIPPAVTFSIIALLNEAPKFDDRQFIRRFTRVGQISDAVANSFRELTVTRKERERIDLILTLWFRLDQMSEEKINPRAIMRRSGIEDLNLLLRAIGLETPLASRVEEAVAMRLENEIPREQVLKRPQKRRPRQRKFDRRRRD